MYPCSLSLTRSTIVLKSAKVVNFSFSSGCIHNMVQVVFRITPLKAFQQFICLDGYRLCKVCRGMVLLPVPVCGKFSDSINRFLFHLLFFFPVKLS